MTNPDTDDGNSGQSLFDMFAAFSLSLSSLNGELKRLNDYNEEQLRQANARRSLPRQLSLVLESVSATNVDILDFGGPQPGRKWEVRGIGIISATAAGFVTMATCVSTWYEGIRMTGNAAGILPLSQARWQLPSVPGNQKFGADEFQIVPQNHLIVGLTGIPAAPTQIYCIALINDLPLYTGRVVSGS